MPRAPAAAARVPAREFLSRLKNAPEKLPPLPSVAAEAETRALRVRDSRFQFCKLSVFIFTRPGRPPSLRVPSVTPRVSASTFRPATKGIDSSRRCCQLWGRSPLNVGSGKGNLFSNIETQLDGLCLNGKGDVHSRKLQKEYNVEVGVILFKKT